MVVVLRHPSLFVPFVMWLLIAFLILLVFVATGLHFMAARRDGIGKKRETKKQVPSCNHAR
jgi:hypothetical protein